MMPENLKEVLIYDVNITAKITTEDGVETSFLHDWKIAVNLEEVNRDDSLRLKVEFLEAKWTQDLESSELETLPLEGNAIYITAFPWGEMLTVDGWDALPEMPCNDTVGIILPLLFPNPPVRKEQQWVYRVLPWRYYGEIPDDYLRLNQKIIANWTQVEVNSWEYEGEWLAKTRLTNIFRGEVEGKLESSGGWLKNHEWTWQRDISYPHSEKQYFTGKIQRLEPSQVTN
jgi:hypothetical protein